MDALARGSKLIVGAHPHVVQREERHGGAVIVHSLGNAVCPMALKGAASGAVRSFRLAAEVPCAHFGDGSSPSNRSRSATRSHGQRLRWYFFQTRSRSSRQIGSGTGLMSVQVGSRFWVVVMIVQRVPM